MEVVKACKNIFSTNLDVSEVSEGFSIKVMHSIRETIRMICLHQDMCHSNLRNYPIAVGRYQTSAQRINHKDTVSQEEPT
jgi:hypothetical protein